MDKMLKPGTNHCKCSGCGEYFTTVANFEMHRRGKAEARNCRNPAELVTKDGKARLSLNAKGYWAGLGGFHG